MKRYAYHVVDVFTRTPLEGNALAVFPDAAGLDDATMQRIAREMNLSETTFVFASQSAEAAADVRIFTPAMEMPFAGHPTIGTAYVLRMLGRIASHVERFTFEERVGPVAVRVEAAADGGAEPMLWLTTPPIERGANFDAQTCARAVGLEASDLIDGVPCMVYSAGNPCVFIAARDASAVDRAVADTALLRQTFNAKGHGACAFVFAPTPAGAYSRMFAPHIDVPEDPATGSATGPLALFMMDHGLAPVTSGSRFVSEQGVKMGRRSVLNVLIHGDHGRDAIEIGGHTVAVLDGTLTLPG